MFGRSGASVLSDGKEVTVSKEHFSSVVIAQMSAYCQRNVEAHLVRHIADQNDQAEFYFILKQILFCIDRCEGPFPRLTLICSLQRVAEELLPIMLTMTNLSR
jgi:hypothetical protein